MKLTPWFTRSQAILGVYSMTYFFQTIQYDLFLSDEYNQELYLKMSWLFQAL